MSRSSEQKKNGCLSRFLRLSFLLVCAVAGLGVAGWQYRDVIKAELRTRVTVRPAKFKMDWKSLLHRQCRGEIEINVGNRLPIGVMLQDLRYSVEINGVNVGSGMQAQPRAAIAALATTTVTVTLYLEASRVGPALALTAPAKVTKLLGTLWDKARGKQPSDPRPLAHIAHLQGQASVRLFSGSLELPLDQSVEFTRQM